MENKFNDIENLFSLMLRIILFISERNIFLPTMSSFDYPYSQRLDFFQGSAWERKRKIEKDRDREKHTQREEKEDKEHFALLSSVDVFRDWRRIRIKRFAMTDDGIHCGTMCRLMSYSL